MYKKEKILLIHQKYKLYSDNQMIYGSNISFLLWNFMDSYILEIYFQWQDPWFVTRVVICYSSKGQCNHDCQILSQGCIAQYAFNIIKNFAYARPISKCLNYHLSAMVMKLKGLNSKINEKTKFQKLAYLQFSLNYIRFLMKLIQKHNYQIKYIIILSMKLQTRPKYAKISLKRRQRLAKLVIQEGMQIARASKILGIRSSTAKLIIKRFKEEGTFFESRQSKERRLCKEKQSLQQSQKMEETIEIAPQLDGNRQQIGLTANLPVFCSNLHSYTEQQSIFPMFLWNVQHQISSWIFFYNSNS